jgi:hypothetical protein
VTASEDRKRLEREGDYERPSLATIAYEPKKISRNILSKHQIQLAKIATPQDDLFGT